MPDVTIRPLGIDERANWEPLWEGYQAFYKVVIPAETTAVTWARLHDATEPMHALGAYVEGRLHGIVHYLFHRSFWTIGDYCAGPVRRRRHAQSRARTRADRGGRGAGAGGGRKPRLLAHPGEQRGGTRTVRPAGGAFRLHPIS
jgi:hypothetical protein